MHERRRIEIRIAARNLHLELWNRRSSIWNQSYDLYNLIPIPTDVIVRSLLEVQLIEPEEISAPSHGYEIAGYMDRSTGCIVIAQKYKPEWRRFTMAHEIAHWVLHPGISYHRDRPLTGAERASPGRPEEEQEADAFAAELVMPKKPLIKWFRDSFGLQVDGRVPDPDMAFRLAGGTGDAVNEIQLSSNLRYRALLVARTSSYGLGSGMVPLAKRFGVSPSAMAIRLEELKLVI